MAEFQTPISPPTSSISARCLIDAKHVWQATREDLSKSIKESRHKAAKQLLRARKRLRLLRRAQGREWQKIVKRDSQLFLDAMYRSTVQNAQTVALSITLEVCKKFLDEELSSAPDPLVRSVQRHLAELADAHINCVRVHPRFVQSLKESFNSQKITIDVIADESIETGKARVDTPHGSILIDWEEDFSQLARTLHSQLLFQWSNHGTPD